MKMTLLSRIIREQFCRVGALVTLPLALAGCAQIQTSSSLQVADQTQAVVQEVRTCAANAGVTLAEAKAKAPADRTNQEWALIEAEQAAQDAQALTDELKSIQQSLDALLPEQRAADAKVASLTAFKAGVTQRLQTFSTSFTKLVPISDALAGATGDKDEGMSARAGELSANRIEVNALVVVGGALAGPLSLPAALAALLVYEITGESEEARLRRAEKIVVQEMLSTMQDARTFITSAGFDATPLGYPIAYAQGFIGQVNNPDRQIKAAPMLSGMISALAYFRSLYDSASAELASAEQAVSGISARTQSLFAKQNEVAAKLKHALDRAKATQTACQFSAFGLIPAVPDWNSTFWDISSP